MQFVPFVNELKLKYAAQDLRLTEKSIMHILTDYGFSYYHNFWRQFEKQFGMSPKDYRKKYSTL
jgi:AraC-like DNA-binding protein